MLPKRLEETLIRLEELVRKGSFEEVETDEFEIKSVPATGGQWTKIYESINAFLNTRGGFVILGIKESGQGAQRRYELTGWRPEMEQKLTPAAIAAAFRDMDGDPLDLSDSIRALSVRPFLTAQIAILQVAELPDQDKYALLQDRAFQRRATGDHEISESQLARQREFCQQARRARELEVVPGTSLEDIDLEAFNLYLQQVNARSRVEKLKTSLVDAHASLEKRRFLRDGQATVLGLLVCGVQAENRLGFRAQVHCFVDVPNEVARDRQVLSGHVPQLMDETLRYVLRQIHVGLTPHGGGTFLPQYPEDLLREIINNALAHRDYKVDKQVVVSIRPGLDLRIRNPGEIARSLWVVSDPDDPVPIRRLIPSAQAPNPALANVLSTWAKWEGRTAGMSSLVDLCLKNQIGLPEYQLRLNEVELRLPAGTLLDDETTHWFASFDRFFAERLGGGQLTDAQRRVLAYLLKSGRANARGLFTVLLTPDNNHTRELETLRASELVREHSVSDPLYPVYVVCEELSKRDYNREVSSLLGERYARLPTALHQQILQLVHRRTLYCSIPGASAKQAAFELWPEQQGLPHDIRGFDTFYRKIRTLFNWLSREGLLERTPSRRGQTTYQLKTQGPHQQHLLFAD